MVDWLQRDVGPRLRRSVMDAIASDRMMIVVKAVAECDPITEEFDDHGGYSQSCFFCGEIHRDDCIHILAKKIMEN